MGRGSGKWYVHLPDYVNNTIWRQDHISEIVPTDVTYDVYQDVLRYFEDRNHDFEYDGSGECVLYFDTYFAARDFASALVRAIRSKWGPDAVRSVVSPSLVEELRAHADVHPWELLSGRVKASTEVVSYLVSCDPHFEEDSKVSDFIPHTV